MGKDLHEIFKNPKDYSVEYMTSRIWQKIKKEREKIWRMKTIGYGVMSVLSVLVLIISLDSLRAEFIRFGFSDYLSLIFSDTGFVAQFWSVYLFTLIDSLPFLSVAFLLFLIFAFLFSSGRLVFQIKNRLLLS